MVEVAGRCYEVSETPPFVEGKVQFLHERNRISLRPATVLADRGSALATAGEHEPALTCFAPPPADRFDPQPRYLEGLTLLLPGTASPGGWAYEATARAGARMVHRRANLWLGVAIGAGTRSSTRRFSLCSPSRTAWGPQRRSAVRQARRSPNGVALPPLYLELGQIAGALGFQQEAEAAYREGLSHADGLRRENPAPRATCRNDPIRG